GYPMPGIAKFIQEQGECSDITRASLITSLRRFSQDMVIGDKLTTRLPHVVVNANKEFADKLEELRRLEKQYEAELYRFDAAHARERMTDTIDRGVNAIQRNLVRIIHQMHSIKMDLGLSGSRDLGTLTVSAERLEEIKEKYGEGAARAMADPVSRGKVMAVLNAARRKAELMEKSKVIDTDFEETII
ncbi:MAG: hypothetical protein ACXQTE_04895, partial [Methanosarcinaceae archaeon]